MINEINNSNLAFTSLRSVKVKGFKNNPNLAKELLERFNNNQGVDSFLHEFDADLTLKQKGKFYQLILNVLNPNKEKTKNFFQNLVVPKKLKIKKHASEYEINAYLNPEDRRRYIEIEAVGKDGSRGYYTPNNINDDIIELKEYVKENSPECKKSVQEQIAAKNKRNAEQHAEDKRQLQDLISSMVSK